MANVEEFTLNDEAIAQIAKVLQIAILTGTDIVDNLRVARFVVEEGQLAVSPGYSEQFNQNLESMIQELNTEESNQTEPSDLQI